MICPLDWGIGHASRMIPLIHICLRAGFKVILASGGKAGELLKTEFPALPFMELPSVPIRYSRKKSQGFIMMIQLPFILAGIFKEHRWLAKAVSKHSIDIVLSDNRYGLYHKKVLSVFMTHQISPLMPAGLKWAEPAVNFFLRRFIRCFDRCWIPDAENPSQNLTGRLSHRFLPPYNTAYMGILSRFTEITPVTESEKNFLCDVLVILSGPEPQRTLLEEILIGQLDKTDYQAVIIGGFHQFSRQYSAIATSRIRYHDHLPSALFRIAILRAEIIICRAGYSTIMDLAELNKPAILIPTPGQPEQEYLAAYMKSKRWFHTAEQHGFDLEKEIRYFRKQKFNPLEIFRTDTEKYLQDLLKLYK
jgi:UDP:flavonoid glycosyltransferase YjiC (YdhE family)